MRKAGVRLAGEIWRNHNARTGMGREILLVVVIRLDTEWDKSNLATCHYRFYLTPLEDLEALNGSGSTFTTCQNRKRRLSTSRAA
jgi:hypothetical protein